MKSIVPVFMIVALSACSITGSQLKEDPGGTIKYVATDNYEVVFRRIVQASKRCYENGERRIEAHIFNDNKSAEITLAIIYGGTIRALYVIDLNAINSQSTDVTGYYLNNIWRKGVEDSKKWAAGRLSVCRFKSSKINSGEK